MKVRTFLTHKNALYRYPLFVVVNKGHSRGVGFVFVVLFAKSILRLIRKMLFATSLVISF